MSLDQGKVWAKTHEMLYCGKQCNPWYDFTIDHMDQKSRAVITNSQISVPCCKACNSPEDAKTVNEFREYLQGKGQHTFGFNMQRFHLGKHRGRNRKRRYM